MMTSDAIEPADVDVAPPPELEVERLRRQLQSEAQVVAQTLLDTRNTVYQGGKLVEVVGHGEKIVFPLIGSRSFSETYGVTEQGLIVRSTYDRRWYRDSPWTNFRPADLSQLDRRSCLKLLQLLQYSMRL